MRHLTRISAILRPGKIEAGVAVGVAMVITVLLSASHWVTEPSARQLQLDGIQVTRVNPDTETPISSAQARSVVRSDFGGASHWMAVELVRFSESDSPRLARPRLAWMVTWRALSQPVTPIHDRQAVTYHRMTEIVSAKTGQMLLAFPDP